MAPGKKQKGKGRERERRSKPWNLDLEDGDEISVLSLVTDTLSTNNHLFIGLTACWDLDLGISIESWDRHRAAKDGLTQGDGKIDNNVVSFASKVSMRFHLFFFDSIRFDCWKRR